MTKTYPLTVVISATTGRILCNIGEFYSILNHVTGDNLFTHVLPRALRFAAPLIKAQYPELEHAGTEESLGRLDKMLTRTKKEKPAIAATCFEWLEQVIETYGLVSQYAIASHADKWLSLNPVEELEAKVGKDKVIVV